jgi:hypothetical protein
MQGAGVRVHGALRNETDWLVCFMGGNESDGQKGSAIGAGLLGAGE